MLYFKENGSKLILQPCARIVGVQGSVGLAVSVGIKGFHVKNANWIYDVILFHIHQHSLAY